MATGLGRIERRIFARHDLAGADPTDNSFESLFKVWASQAHHLLNGYDIQDASEMTVSILATFNIEIENELPKPPAGTDFHDDFLYLFCRPPDTDSINYKCPTYWTLDPEGQHRLTDSEMEERFGTTSIAAKMVCSSYIVPSHIYPILHKIHTACGFNPHSTEMAEYLGLPVLEPVADLDVSGVADTRD
ncbi:hypothetical protein C8J56DRAFT_113123 [Mycena floridula]|nr:hypothetical protein C8J56DRAFT_113123 [Mycena floridula]